MDLTTVAAETQAEVRRAGGVVCHLNAYRGYLSLDSLGVAVKLRRQELGTRAAAAVCAAADQHQLPVVIEPDTGFGSDFLWLVPF